MPCTDGGDYPSNLSINEAEELKQRLDLATRVACEALRKLPPKSRRRLSVEAREWGERHREEDKKRAAKEKLKARKLHSALDEAAKLFNDGAYDDALLALRKGLADIE